MGSSRVEYIDPRVDSAGVRGYDDVASEYVGLAARAASARGVWGVTGGVRRVSCGTMGSARTGGGIIGGARCFLVELA
jgi:hypothetical protein